MAQEGHSPLSSFALRLFGDAQFARCRSYASNGCEYLSLVEIYRDNLVNTYPCFTTFQHLRKVGGWGRAHGCSFEFML